MAQKSNEKNLLQNNNDKGGETRVQGYFNGMSSIFNRLHRNKVCWSLKKVFMTFWIYICCESNKKKCQDLMP